MLNVRMMLILLAFVFGWCGPGFSICSAFAAESAPNDAPQPNWEYVRKKLAKEHFKPSFLKALKKLYDPSDFQSIVELNCLLFLRKADYHTPQVSEDAVKQVRQFMAVNQKALHAAEKKYGVSAAAISGLLWMESRYGENTGRYPVASAFINLVQADRPQMIAHLKLQAAPRFTRRLSIRVAREITKKAAAKSKWAIGELQALEKMYGRDRKLVKALKGSFAGAFGMPQFLPSSYNEYAKAYRKGKTPNLHQAEDAIHSVAFYLHKSGWKKGKRKSYEIALLKYNKSHDYANAILMIASQVTGEEFRAPASRKKTAK